VEVIRDQDVEHALDVELTRLHEQLFQLKRKKLEELIAESSWALPGFGWLKS
jgi:hypothetical protein